MRNFLITLLFFGAVLSSQAQELNATVTIDAVQTGQPNLQVFRTLEQQLTEFLNQTRWTNRVYKNQERIDCNFSIIVSSFDSTTFLASLQIQASRPVYGSTYDSPIYNYNDQQFNFEYVEFQPLNFNPNTFSSNLVSVLAYHVYTIIGLDADTFEANGGIEYFQTAKQIVNTASVTDFSGWKATSGRQSRFQYNDALLSTVYAEFHAAMYDYHRFGMDKMVDNQLDAKQNIILALEKLKNINDRRPNSFLLRTFFDAKAEEIAGIYSGGPKVDIARLTEILNRMAPTKNTYWGEIKY